MTFRVQPNIVTSTRPDCSQLFFVFTGIIQKVLGLPPLDFLQKARLANRNFVVLKDPSKRGFRCGVSDEIPDLESLFDWQRNYVLGLSHVREVYCIGVSAGAIPAIMAGHYLGAEGVWAFSGRPPSEKWTRQQAPAGFVRNIISKNTRYLRDYARRYRVITSKALANAIEIPADTKLDMSMIDSHLIDQAVAKLNNHNGKTEYRLYYVPSNAPDAYVNQRLADCPGTVSVPVHPPADYPHIHETSWDHNVLSVLNAKGSLSELFPPFASI